MSEAQNHFLIIVPAAGTGTRMGAGVPKQYLKIGNPPKTLLELSVAALHQALPDARIVVAVRPGDEQVKTLSLPEAEILTSGGETRAQTVYQTLSCLKDQFDPATLVLVHDAARALIEPEDIRHLAECAADVIRSGACCGAVLTTALPDTVKRVNAEAVICEDIERTGLVRIATPQAFPLSVLLKALENNKTATDESSAVRGIGGKVCVVSGSPLNFKITEPGDLQLARRLAEKQPKMHIGIGYDSHRLVIGRKLILGGVEIPFEKGLDGHSDADVLIHAVIDALLGAAHLGNIGLLFPNTDPAYKDVDSAKLLQETIRLVREKGWTIENLDTVLITEAPKINPHLAKIERRLAQILDIPVEDISVKPKTNERLGFEGRSEGISAQAVVLLKRKPL